MTETQKMASFAERHGRAEPTIFTRFRDATREEFLAKFERELDTVTAHGLGPNSLPPTVRIAYECMKSWDPEITHLRAKAAELEQLSTDKNLDATIKRLRVENAVLESRIMRANEMICKCHAAIQYLINSENSKYEYMEAVENVCGKMHNQLRNKKIVVLPTRPKNMRPLRHNEWVKKYLMRAQNIGTAPNTRESLTRLSVNNLAELFEQFVFTINE